MADAVNGYGHPHKGPRNELASLNFQLNRLKPHDPAIHARLDAALGLFARAYPRYTHPLLDEDSIRERIKYLMDYRVVPYSSPGFPLMTECANTNDAIKRFGRLVLDIAVYRVLWFLDNDLSHLTPVEAFERCLSDCWKIHIKEEPHPIEKIKNNRFRLIFGGALVNALVERFFNQDYQDACTARYLDIPAQPGLGFTDSMASEIYSRMRDIPKVTSDIQGWDFSVYGELLRKAAEIRISSCDNPDPRWRRGVMNTVRNITHKLVTFSNGEVWEISDGIMSSGSFLTASLNSDARALLAAAVDLHLGAKPDPKHYRTMGDDIVQFDYGFSDSELKGAYADFGFTVTDIARAGVNEKFSFCSHSFCPDGIILETSARTLFRLLGHEPQVEFLTQFIQECRHNPDLISSLTILFYTGWDLMKFEDHHGLNEPAPIDSGKMSTKKKNKAAGNANKQKQAQVRQSAQRAAAIVERDMVPAAYGRVRRGGGPSMVQASRDCICIKHKELFDWPLGYSPYTVNAFLFINPANSGVFPWLYRIAINFEKYRFRKLKFTYYPRCGSTQAGQAVLAVDPKSSDNAPVSLPVLSSYHVRSQGPMWKEFSINVPQDVLGRELRYTRPAAFAAAGLSTLYDVGRFIFATDGANPAGATIGELEVSYEVELHLPASPPETPVPSAYINGGGAASSSNLFGATPVAGGLLYSTHLNNVISLHNIDMSGNIQTDEYVVSLAVYGTGISALTLAPTGFIKTNMGPVINAAGTSLINFWVVTFTASSPLLTFTCTATTVTDAQLAVTQVGGVTAL